MERAPQAKIVFRVVPAQCDDDFVIFAIYPGLGAARFYRRPGAVSGFAGAVGFLWRSCSKNPAGMSGLDATFFRLRHGTAFRCGSIYLADLVRARSGAATTGAGVALVGLGRGRARLDDPVWHLCTILCRSADIDDAARRLAIRRGDSCLCRSPNWRRHLPVDARRRQTFSALADTSFLARSAILAGSAAASACSGDHARVDGYHNALPGYVLQSVSAQFGTRHHLDVPRADDVCCAGNVHAADGLD